MKLDLVIHPDPRLKRNCWEIPDQDIKTSKIKDLAKNMIETMKAYNGIGLAAPQVGENLRLIVVDTSAYQPFLRPRSPFVMINPKVMYIDNTCQGTIEEGCLSFIGQTYPVKRSQKIIVHYKDLNGDHQIDLFTGITAVCVQHEVDHLDGITMDERSRQTI